MDANLIYAKTPAGEQAMRQRTGFVQRHLRMVLILVDGRTTVGELGDKVGHADLVENALIELEKGGFIALSLASPSVWDKSLAVVQKVKEVALESFSSFGAPSMGRSESSQASAGKASPPKVAWLAGLPGNDALPEKASAGSAERAPSAIRSLLGRLFDVVSQRQRKILGLMAALLVLLGALPAVYPYDRHRPQMEALLSQVFGLPIQAKSLRAQFFPRPQLVLEEVTIGERERITVAQLRFWPPWERGRALAYLEVDGANLSQAALLAIPQWVAGARQAGVQVDKVLWRDLSLQVGHLAITDLSGLLTFNAPGQGLKLALQNGDHGLSLEMNEAPGGWQVIVDGQDWAPFKDQGWRFDYLNGRGMLTAAGLDFPKVEGRVLEGAFTASASLQGQNEVRLRASLALKHLSLHRLGQVFAPSWQGEGEMEGSVRMEGNIAPGQGIGDTLQGEGEFSLQKGLLPLDLAEAAKEAPVMPRRGGQTSFDRAHGAFRFDSRGVQLSLADLSAGLLNASGNVLIGKLGKLEGGVNVQLGGKEHRLQMPLLLGGVLADPTLQIGVRPNK